MKQNNSRQTMRLRMLATVVALTCGTALLAGSLGFWRASAEMDRRMLVRTTNDLARLITELRLPATSKRLVAQLKQVSGCDVYILDNTNNTNNTKLLAGTLTELPKLPSTGLCHMRSGDVEYLCCTAALDDGRRLCLLKPREQARKLLRGQGWSMALVAAVAGIAAAVAAWRLAAAYNRMHQKLTDADHRLARAERLAVAGRLSASVVHELRNPLAGIRMNAQVLAEDMRERGENDEILDLMTREIDRINAYLAALTGLEPTAAPDKNTSAPINQAIREAGKLLAGRCSHANIQLNFNSAPEIDVFCSADELKQLLLNIMGNAIEAMPGGGIINIETHLHDDFVAISVTDDGPGIHSKDDIFAPFVSQKPRGSGLGLHICKRIAERYSGNITWENVPGHGARFTITLHQTRHEA